MSTADLDALIVEHLADIDAAVKRLSAFEPDVFRALDQAAKEWAKNLGWSGEFDCWADDLWLAPPTWKKSADESEEWTGWFAFEAGAGDNQKQAPGEDHFSLTRLCQVGVGKYGFRFKTEVVTGKKWKRFIRDRLERFRKTTFAPDLDTALFMEFKIDHLELAKAIAEEDIDAALGEFRQALDRLASALPSFDRLISDLRTEEATS